MSRGGLKRLWTWLLQLGSDLKQHDAYRAASAMAFHAFFSLVPLVALIGYAAHQLSQSSHSLLGPVTQLAPRSVAQLADTEFMRISDASSNMLPPLSIVGLLWLATDGVATAMREFERIFDAAVRPFWKCRLVALGYVLMAILMFTISGTIAIWTGWDGSAVEAIVAVATPLATLWLLVAGFFRIAIVREEGAPRSGFRGAAVTLMLWLLVSAGFTLYVREIASYSRFYGSLATVAVLLVWLWLMSLSLLIGGEINARVEGIR